MSRSADGKLVTLRGHSAFIPRLCRWLAAGVAVGALFAVHGYATRPSDEGALVGAIVGALLSIALFGGARWRLRHPDRHLVIDLAGQTLTAFAFGKRREPIPFAELGPMNVGSITIASTLSTGGRRHIHQSVIGLSKHPGVVLYEPGGPSDLQCFVVTLRELIGERHLPRAEPTRGRS
jgi:hypothetical protein